MARPRENETADVTGVKVVHINEHLALKGGVETYLHTLLPMLSARGVESVLVHDHEEENVPFRTKKIEGIGKAAFGVQSRARTHVLSFLEEEAPDVVHVHNVQNVGVLQACLRYGRTLITAHDYRLICPASSFFFKRPRTICTRHGAGPGCFLETATKKCLTPRPQYASYYYYRAKWAMKHLPPSAFVIAPSTGARRRFLAAAFLPEHVHVLPYFCPVVPATKPRPVPPDVTITYIGRIAANKGADYFVSALALLPAHVRGLIVGNVSDEAAAGLKRRAEEGGCLSRLAFQPWAARDDVPGVLDKTTVLVFPSLWPETLGIVGLEALARGVPVVASDVGGVREWLRDGENGFVVPPKSPEQIAQAVLRLISTDEGLQAFGATSIETVRTRFLPDHHLGALLPIYEDVARMRQKRTAP